MNNTTQNKLADMFSKRFQDYNTKVLKKLAEVIKKFDGLTYTEASQLAQQLRYDRSYIDLVDELSRMTKKSKKEIKKILEETINQHIEFSDTFFKAKGMTTPVYKDDIYLRELVNSVAKVSEGDFVNLAKSTGFAFLDKNNHIIFLDMQETYYKVIDECVYAISEGKDTFNNAMRKTINQLADSGVRRIIYKNDGKRQYTERIDSAVRRNILDSIREVSIEVQKEFGKRFGADGVEVTVHSQPAPDHEYVQGHQFRNEEFEKFQTDEDCEDVNGIKYPAISDETGRDRRSIGQYNCYHTAFSIIVGVSKPLYSDEELQKIIDENHTKINIDGKEYTKYEATQLQRSIETQIRYEKDAQIMYKDLDRAEAEKHQLNITRLTRKYKEISNKANIREQLNRASVSGYRPIKVKNTENITLSDKNKKPIFTIKDDIYKNVVQGKDLSNIDEYDVEKIVKMQGFDGKPILIKDEKVFEQMVSEDTVGMYRGIYGGDKATTKKYKDMLRKGKFVMNSDNQSVSGKGLYTTAYNPGDIKAQNEAREYAEKYARFRSMFTEPGTKVEYKDSGQVERFTFTKDVKIYIPNEKERILKDYEIAKKGYDAYYNRNKDYVIILNRTKMIILDK